MNLTAVQLTEFLQLLDEARRTSWGPGEGHYCPVARVGPDGATFRIERKPRATAEVGTLLAGLKVKQDRDGKYIEVPLGSHGRAFLGVEPETGTVVCTACEKGIK